MEGDSHRNLPIWIVEYFNPLPPHGGRLPDCIRLRRRMLFQSTPSAWRETSSLRSMIIPSFHFNPLPPHGGRRFFGQSTESLFYFNPLPPHGGRPNFRIGGTTSELFQSTPSAWRETISVYTGFPGSGISIHSLRMEGDERIGSEWILRRNFNPLPPHGGRLFRHSAASLMYTAFQSTPSAWRETEALDYVVKGTQFQSTPSAWRETLFLS